MEKIGRNIDGTLRMIFSVLLSMFILMICDFLINNDTSLPDDIIEILKHDSVYIASFVFCFTVLFSTWQYKNDYLDS